MANPGSTEVFLLENAETIIYEHVEKELADGLIAALQTDFTVTTAPVSITALQSTVEPQYVDANDRPIRKDVLVYYRKDGKDTIVDTSSNAITISGTTLTFTTAPTAAEADSVVVSYSHTPSNRTDEIVEFGLGGGDRSLEFVTVQGGKKVKIKQSQGQKSVNFKVLSVDLGFVSYLNGEVVSESITQGSDTNLLKATLGAQARTSKAIVITVDDPDTGNIRYEMFWNVDGVSDDGNAPSDSYIDESCAFECAPQDYQRMVNLYKQG